MKKYLKPFFLLSLITVNMMPGFSQENLRMITVKGKVEYNLSPNEIVVQINYEEYFLNGIEKQGNKVAIDKIEQRVLATLKESGIKKEKITMGGASIVRPYENNSYLKRRVNKSLFVGVVNTNEYIQLTLALEKNGLFDQVVTDFKITEYRHTDREAYLTKIRKEAFIAADKKARLILAGSGQKVGKIARIKELDGFQSRVSNASFYSVNNTSSNNVSGFQPVKVSYELEVMFEIL